MPKRKRSNPTISSVEELPYLQAISAERPHETDPPLSFYLPRLSIPGPKDSNEENLQLATSTRLSVKTLAAAIQNECSPAVIKSYIRSYEAKDIKKVVRTGVKPTENVDEYWGVIFFAIERNSAEVLRILLDTPGMDPNAMSASEPRLPAHVFAIISSKWTLRDPTEVVQTLLAYGASPEAIPRFFWTDPFLDMHEIDRDHIENRLKCQGLTIEGILREPKTEWIGDLAMSAALIDTFHLTHRYNFYRAHGVPMISGRRSQMFEDFKLDGLLRLPFYSSQDVANNLVMDNVFAHKCLLNSKVPLVMAFAGPSGHGQLELAKRMSQLLDAPFNYVDCCQIKSFWSLFDQSFEFSHIPDNSRLDEFLFKVNGQRAVVFLDNCNEIKNFASSSLYNLAAVIESGFYMDEDSFETSDTSKVIWIMRTNLGESDVLSTSKRSMDVDGGRELKVLQAKILTAFNSNGWEARFTDLIRAVIPFFSTAWPEVIVHKLLLELSEDVRKPIDLRPDVKRYIGHVHLNMPNSTAMCMEIGETCYNKKNGDPSFLRPIEEIKTKLSVAYARHELEVTERTNDRSLTSFNVFVEPKGTGYGMDSIEDEPPLNPIVVTNGPSFKPKRLVKPYHHIDETED
ncbi:hypothetical protein HDK77DRAFT_173269 [Phyllosticta capitalensis]